MTAALLALYLAAFARVESGGNYNAVGDHGNARGCWQFHATRWAEMGGNPASFGRATKSEQDAVMSRALQRYAATRPDDVDLTVWLGNWHNAGHGSARETAYTRKLRAALAEVAQ